MLIVKQGGIKYHFLAIGMTRPGIKPRSPGPLANTLLIRPVAHSRKQPVGSLFNSYNTTLEEKAQLISLDCSTLPLICTL